MKNINLFKFVIQNENSQRAEFKRASFLTGVYHSNGYKYATNGSILIRIKSEYDDIYENKIMLQSHQLIQYDYKYTFEEMFKNRIMPHDKKCIDIRINFSKFEKIYKQSILELKSKNHKNVINIMGEYFDFEYFNLMMKTMRKFKIKILELYHNDDNIRLIARTKDDDVMLILAPLFKRKDVNYTIYNIQ